MGLKTKCNVYYANNNKYLSGVMDRFLRRGIFLSEKGMFYSSKRSACVLVPDAMSINWRLFPETIMRRAK